MIIFIYTLYSCWPPASWHRENQQFPETREKHCWKEFAWFIVLALPQPSLKWTWKEHLLPIYFHWTKDIGFLIRKSCKWKSPMHEIGFERWVRKRKSNISDTVERNPLLRVFIFDIALLIMNKYFSALFTCVFLVCRRHLVPPSTNNGSDSTITNHAAAR